MPSSKNDLSHFKLELSQNRDLLFSQADKCLMGDFCPISFTFFAQLLFRECQASPPLENIPLFLKNLEQDCLVLAKKIELSCIKAIHENDDPKYVVPLALKKLILHKILDLHALFSPYLPYHNVLHSCNVAKDAAILAKGINYSLGGQELPLDMLQYLLGVYHDIRLFYNKKSERISGSDSKTASEGLSVEQMKQDFQMLEVFIQKQARFTFRFSSLFHKQAKESILNTIPSFNPKHFAIHNNAYLDAKYIDEKFDDNSLSLLSAPDTQFKKHCDMFKEKFAQDPTAIETLYQKVFNSFIALADLSSSLSNPQKWLEEEVPALFIEENHELFYLLQNLHAQYPSFEVLPKDIQKQYLHDFKSIKSWYKNQVFFAQCRWLNALFRFIAPLKSALCFLKCRELDSKESNYYQTFSKIDENLSYLFNYPSGLFPKTCSIRLALEKASSLFSSEELHENAIKSQAFKLAMNQTSFEPITHLSEWEFCERLLKLRKKRSYLLPKTSSDSYQNFLHLSGQLRIFP